MDKLLLSIPIINFFQQESKLLQIEIIFMAIISSIANVSVLIVINFAIENLFNSSEEPRIFLLYLVTIILFILSRNYSFGMAVDTIEEANRQISIRIANKIRHSELLFIENNLKTDIYSKITQDINLISQSGINLLNIILIIVSLITSLLYVAWLSLPGFLLMIIALGLGIIQMFYQQDVHDAIQLSISKERKFLNQLSQVLEGFKEIKINHAKSDELFQHIDRTSVETKKIKVDVGRQFVVMSTSLRNFYNVLLGFMVFLLPLLNLVDVNELFQLVVITVFITRPMDGLADYIPVVTRANAAIENIQNFEKELDTQLKIIPDYEPDRKKITDFNEIKLNAVTFRYTSQTGEQHLFLTGPLNFNIKKGETVFIIGGNGSGKSTLLKLLIGLYYPLSGHLTLDDEEIDEYTYSQYRSLFSTVFSDFYLFDRFYGLSDIDEKKLNALLRLMELHKKTQYLNGQFTHTHLSTGQRKRLALVIALMEDKPIYLFDEWAADQDPIFRTYFYQVLLKELKAQGKTIIAVTHDDRYFSLADRVIKMEEGKILPA